MNEKIKHGRSKLISNYGGVGSLIETQDCSVIIETFDNWQYKDLLNRLSEYIIKDDRLLNRLKSRFPNIRHIVQIPTEGNSKVDNVRPSANYFSKWFYCTKCNRFAEYEEWKKRWIASGKNLDFFNPPKCTNPECREETVEQIRFVMTCKNGHIHDIPWRHWNSVLPEDESKEQDDNDDDSDENPISKLQGPKIDLSKTCCNTQDLRFEISKENTELTGMRVVCKSCKKNRTLKGLFGYETNCSGVRYWLGMLNGKWQNEICDQDTKVAVKASNSVYYSNTLSSIYIPERQSPITNEIRIEIDNLIESGDFTQEEIIKNVSLMKKIPKETIKNYLDTGNSTYTPDTAYREAEYSYLLNGENSGDSNLITHFIDCKKKLLGFESLVKVEKLKKITVQTSFTRQEPIDVDSILQEEDSYAYSVKRQSVSKNNFETKLLPGIESYGEGILFVLNTEMLKTWASMVQVKGRANIIKSNATNSSWKYHQIIANTITPNKILIHTLSHLFMRELEYVCGYPASSLQERLYVSDSMNGFLISAYDGTDGYLGGLANLCVDLDKLEKIIDSAIHRAQDCSSDPICISSDGQGVGQLNLAGCHSCVMVPEVTCELSNLFLDRKLIVDESFGFFRSLLKK